MPAQVGIQNIQLILDACLRRNDGHFRNKLPDCSIKWLLRFFLNAVSLHETTLRSDIGIQLYGNQQILATLLNICDTNKLGMQISLWRIFARVGKLEPTSITDCSN